MVRKIFKAGNSVVLALPKEMLQALGLEEGAEVSVELDAGQGRIVIAPASALADGVDSAFAAQVASFIERYRPALEALAR
jgi:putative addiction module antidote